MIRVWESEIITLRIALITIIILLVSGSVTTGQSSYTDKGHWVGLRLGYVPIGPERGVGGIAMYEYRFDRSLSLPLDLTGIELSSGFTFILSGGLRLRIPIGKVNKNVYAQVGIGPGGIIIPVLHAAAGFEYGITDRVGIIFQCRQYTANLEHFKPDRVLYSLGVNIDITPRRLRESYLMGE